MNHSLREGIPIGINTQHRDMARPPEDSYVRVLTLPPILVPLVPTRLTPKPTPCFLVQLQATISNAGIIYWGGSNLTATAGQELDGGRGQILSTDFNPIQKETGSIGMSNMRRTTDSSIPKNFMLLDLYDIWIMASIDSQTLRVMYMVPVR
jgi:hypothetical protein